MSKREVTAKMSVSRFSMALSRVRRISAGEKRLKTSSEDSGSSQNYGPLAEDVRTRLLLCDETDRGPVGIVGGYVSLLRQPKDTLLEDELGVTGTHDDQNNPCLQGEVVGQDAVDTLREGECTKMMWLGGYWGRWRAAGDAIDEPCDMVQPRSRSGLRYISKYLPSTITGHVGSIQLLPTFNV